MNKNIGIVIKVGNFSFAELPNRVFESVLGVTGTLLALGDFEKNIIENDYQIKRKTIVPSMFGESNFKKGLRLTLTKFEEFYIVLDKEIKISQLAQDNYKRPVIALFANEKLL